MTKIPHTQQKLKESNLAFSLYFQPFTEIPPHENPIPKIPVTDKIFRCNHCQSYINLNYKIIYSQTTHRQVAICNLCSSENELDISVKGVKNSYLEADTSNVIEMTIPTIDFHLSNNDDSKAFTPHYMFIIDISYSCYELGLSNYVIDSIQNNLESFHNANDTHIAICTYNDKMINFFYCEKNEIKCVHVTDINQPFCPVAMNKLFINITSERANVDKLIEKISAYIQITNVNQTKKTSSSITGAAIYSGIESLMDNGGRVMIFTSNACTHGFGGSKIQNEKELFNTESESKLYQPQHCAFNDIIKKATENKIVVDQFIIGPSQYDLVTFSLISNLTGGHVRYYQLGKEKASITWTFEKLYYDLIRIISRPNYYDIKFMIRTTEGIDCFEISGAFNKSFGEAFRLPGCDPDYSFSYNFRISKDLNPNQVVHFQIACLFIDNFNRKYLRIFNYAIIATDEIGKIYLSSDVDALSKIMIMKEIIIAIQKGPEIARKSLCSRLLNSFVFYRKEGSNEKDPGQLILPSSMKYLPMYLNSFIKKYLFSHQKKSPPLTANVLIDLMNKMTREPVYSTIRYLYPKLYRIDNMQYEQSYQLRDKTILLDNIGLVKERYGNVQLPFMLPLSLDHIDFDSAYLIDNGEYIHLFIFNYINGEFYNELFNANDWNECVERQITGLEQEENINSDLYIRINNTIDQLRRDNGGCNQVVKTFFLSDRMYNSVELMSLLIEDKFNDEPNYVDFLCKLHEDIQRNMN